MTFPLPSRWLKRQAASRRPAPRRRPFRPGIEALEEQQLLSNGQMAFVP
jgi:hypothetical protein